MSLTTCIVAKRLHHTALIIEQTHNKYIIHGGPKTKDRTFVDIFADQFSIFSPVDSVRNLLLIGMHTTPTMSLDNLVKRKYLKYLKTNKNWFKPSNRRTYNQRLYVGFRIFLFFSFSAISL